ncbi:MAG: sigma-70 family RNA polymerase sigma factor [Saprospiraceae bacterium]|nr:sigma-70 family RNA polymerase sigma factor [Saprospiraceae bacterium]
MEAFERIYDLYMDDFLNSASYKYNSVPHEDLLDAWQDTVISFFEQIRSGKITQLSCSIRTFLFLLGFRYISKNKKKYIKEISSDTFEQAEIPESIMLTFDYEEPDQEDRQLMLDAIEELPAQSKKMLQLRYIEGKTIDEIVKVMQYNSVNAVSVTLSRNLKRLKEIIESKQNARII